MKIDRRLLHKANREDALVLLQNITELFNKHNIAYYLDFGTLLGAVRENAFIRWDTNINLSILNESDQSKIPFILKELDQKYKVEIKRFSKERNIKKEIKDFIKTKILRKKLCKKLGLYKCEGSVSDIEKKLNRKSYRLVSIYNSDKNILLEIFFKYEFDNYLYWKAYGKVKRVPVAVLGKELKEIQFYNLTVTIPSNVNEYLTYLYDDWRTPLKEYSQEDGKSMLVEYRKRQSGDRRFVHTKNKQEMIKLLNIVVKTLEKHNIEYYIDMGTLLGAVREGGLMDWDDDVDISLTRESDFDKIPQVLKDIENQYECETNLYTFKDSQIEYSKYIDKYVEPKEIDFTDVNNYHIAKIRNRRIYDPNDANVILDLFFQYRDSKYIYWFMFGKVYKVPVSVLNEGFTKIDFHGIKCNIPKNYDNYLKHIFGDDWRIPNPDWEEEDCPALDDAYRDIIPEDRRFKHDKNQKEAIRLLRIVDSVLKLHNIKYYLDFGTLIGAVRDGGFIPWDDDIDISLVDESDFYKMPLVVSEIKRRCHTCFAELYSFRHSQIEYEASQKQYVRPKKIEFTDPYNPQVAIIKSFKKWRPEKGNVIIDIFCKYRYKGDLYWMAFGKEYKMPYSPLEKGFEEIDFYGIKCLIPKAYDEYLSNHYGNWKIENKDWTQEESNAIDPEYREKDG